MPTPTVNYEWPQGEDLVIKFVYSEGELGQEQPVDLDGWAVRMDIVHPITGELLYTFNSDDNDPDTEDEGELNAGGVIGAVEIEVPRKLTLPGDTPADNGVIYNAMLENQLVFEYDVFLRDTISDKQKKMYGGTVTIEPSRTLWR